MDNLRYSLNAVLPLLMLIAAGQVFVRLNIASSRFFQEANRFVFKVSMPLLLCRNIYRTDFSAVLDPPLILFGLGSVVLVAMVSSLITPFFVKDRASTGTIVQALFRGNFSLFGLPLAINLFGQEGAAPTTMMIAFTVPVFAILAVVFLSIHSPQREQAPGGLIKRVLPVLWDIVKNPLILGSFAGLIINILPTTLPGFVDKAIADIGALAVPLSLIVLGSQFDFSQLKGRIKLASTVAVIRLTLVPLAMVSLAVLAGFRDVRLGTIYVLFASPTSVASYVMARDMNSDHVLAGQIIILTALLCGLTLFGGIYILKTLTLI